MLRADENDKNTSWLVTHAVVWEIFSEIGLCVERFVFSSFSIKSKRKYYLLSKNKLWQQTLTTSTEPQKHNITGNGGRNFGQQDGTRFGR